MPDQDQLFTTKALAVQGHVALGLIDSRMAINVRLAPGQARHIARRLIEAADAADRYAAAARTG